MELTGAFDMDERAAAIKAQVDAEMIEREAEAIEAAGDAVSGRVLVHLGGRDYWTTPPTPAFERGARVVALLAMGGTVLAVVVALILAA